MLNSGFVHYKLSVFLELEYSGKYELNLDCHVDHGWVGFSSAGTTDRVLTIWYHVTSTLSVLENNYSVVEATDGSTPSIACDELA